MSVGRVEARKEVVEVEVEVEVEEERMKTQMVIMMEEEEEEEDIERRILFGKMVLMLLVKVALARNQDTHNR
jgi:hypothetical protein